MKLKTVEFAGAIGRPGQDPPGTLPQVAFAGRSNVGKSSLINRLLERHRKNIARVSASPGKTQEINFYRIRAELDDHDDDFFLVDLPGYGFARAPRPVREAWRPLIEGYLRRSEELLGVVQLIDARHEPTPDDLRMIDFLGGIEMPTLIVLTKVDSVVSTTKMQLGSARLFLARARDRGARSRAAGGLRRGGHRGGANGGAAGRHGRGRRGRCPPAPAGRRYRARCR